MPDPTKSVAELFKQAQEQLAQEQEQPQQEQQEQEQQQQQQQQPPAQEPSEAVDHSTEPGAGQQARVEEQKEQGLLQEAGMKNNIIYV